MSFDSDIALLGTGVAPLAAAIRLLAEGKSVLLLNPEYDFFREDSELPLDPLWPLTARTLTPGRLARSSSERALAQLRPDFPGAIELWPETRGEGYHDRFAPHVRNRSRLWIRPGAAARDWELIENMYVEASDAGLNPQILEGIIALKRFPGSPAAPASEEYRGVLLPKMGDVDVSRYRNGLLEFVRERLGPERIIPAATQIDLIPEGVRFHAQGTPRTARLRDGLLVFWTPRLTAWVLAQAKRAETAPRRPAGVRLWEQWSLASRDALDPGIVGTFDGMSVWAELEGAPAAGQELSRLAVLRPGPLVALDSMNEMSAPSFEGNWASAESFGALSRLCHEFLKWDRFSVQSMRPRALFEWGDAEGGEPCWRLSEGALNAQVIGGCDGPLVDVVRVARQACDRLGEARAK